MSSTDHDKIRNVVMDKYAEIVTEGKTCCSTSVCCADSGVSNSEAYAKALGYTAEDLKNLPEGANMGLSCGNPTAMASLKKGDTVLDLGSGGGFDVFVAARKVHNEGKAIGVDMTPAMIRKARQNNAKFQERTGLNNVDFRLGEIEHLPVADSSVDVVISNCVINLSPDKEQVWKEVARVLKPGGRACISDIALLQPLPDCIKESIHALVGCVAGASLIDDILSMVEAAGLVVTNAEKEQAFVHEMETSSDPLYKDIMKVIPEGMRPGDYVTSLKLVVSKPPK